MHDQKETEFNEFRKSMRVFLDLPSVEAKMKTEIEKIVHRAKIISLNEVKKTDLEALVDYLGSGDDTEFRLKIVLGLTGSSLERLKRICLEIKPDESWSQVLRSKDALRSIANLLLFQEETNIFIPDFVANCLRLPQNWRWLLQSEDNLRVIATHMLRAKYAVISGTAMEENVRSIVQDAKYTFEKGRVDIVDDKEVDIAIPNLDQPQFLIMSSYQLTTSSSQSSRANEQASMYRQVQDYNLKAYKRKHPPVWFINIIDGGGWIDRNSDLRKMYNYSDYCLSNAQLIQLPNVLRSRYIHF